MINDKKYRLSLIERYLNADTSVEEEALLAEYYRAHKAEAEEKAAAILILMSNSEEASKGCDSSEEFDRIIAAESRRRSRIWTWSASVASIAAAVALLFILKPTAPSDPQTPILDIIQSMSAMEEFGHVKNVESEQIGDMIFLTLTLDNGQESSYIMMKNDSNGTLSYIPAVKYE